MTKTIIIAVEKMDDDSRLQIRETVVGIRIVKDHYSEADIQQLLEIIITDLKPTLTRYLNAN